VLVDSVPTTTPRQDLIHRVFLAPLPSSRIGQLTGLAIMGFAIKLAQDLITMVRTLLSNRINYNGLLRVRCDLYRKLQLLNLAYHQSQPQGNAIYRLSTDTFGCQAILGALINTAVAVGTLAVMVWILWSRNASLTLLAMLVAPGLFITNVIFERRLKRRSLEAKQVDTQFTTAIQRSMSSIGLTQAFVRENEEFTHFQRSAGEIIAAWWRLNWQEVLYWLIVGTIFGVGGALIFGYGGYLVYRDQFAHPIPDGMTVGDLMIFTSYLGMLWGPLCSITGFSSTIQGGVSSVQRVFEVLDRDPVIQDAPGAISLPRQPRTLALEEVCFAYSPGRPILREVNMTIRPGQMVAFIGASGTGKSTLLNLLPRFYDPTAGVMTLDGIDARQIKLADLRRHVALVLQESVILPTTIAENIAYGKPDATIEQIRAAAELAGASGFIEQLPEAYQSPVSERGQNLSGGQRQRLSIARALLSEAPFVILDEPTSALDPIHGQIITQSLKGLKRQRTIIIVSRRLSTVMECDQIFVMDQGQVVEQGTHEQLLAQRGLYHTMASHQAAAEVSASAAGRMAVAA
jgi:subfamily B ATP-binding cassette protein MsbA